jgi:hypothetical protein
MKDEENLVSYFLRVDEIVDTIRGIDENFEELIIVKKVLRYIPLRFEVVFSIKEMKDMEKFMMD